MAVKIGHASLDENKSGRNGVAGDQTGREVYTTSWYNGNWTTLVRPKTKSLAEAIAKACEAGCANNNIGYDMNQRNTLRTAAKAAGWDLSKITTACETDCSAFITVCTECAGVDMSGAYTSGNAPVTWNMAEKFKATGAFVVLTDSKYLSSSTYVIRGDILIKDGHVVMVLSDGSNSDRTGQSSVGWLKDSKGWRYLCMDGSYLKSKWAFLVDSTAPSGTWYRFNENGYAITNTTVTIDGTEYTFDSIGHIVVKEGEKLYIDVKEGAWYSEAVEYVTEKGLMQGVGDEKFDPERAVTRAELAQAIANLYKTLTE